MTASLWTRKSKRLMVGNMCCLALTIEGLMRSNINMAMVCMLTEKSLASTAQTTSATGCEMLDLKFLGYSSKPPPGTLEWSAYDRAFIFTSFYLGGLFACFFIEMLNRRFGPKKVVLYGAIANVVGTFLTPIIARDLGVFVLLVVRLIMGFGQGLLWPCMNVLVTHWFPADEKSTALAITTTGNQLSVIIAMFVTAELCQLPMGWPMAFHVYGVIGLFLCCLWIKYVEDSPADCKDITQAELDRIHGGTGRVKPRKVAWSVLCRSPLIWAIAASSFAHNYITVGTVTYLPLYYKTVLKLSLTTNGLLSALPFVFQLISKFLYAGFADACKKRGYLSFTTVTKISNTSASFGLAVCFLLLCFCDCSNRLLAVVLICLAMAFVSGYVPGYNTSIVVVAPAQTAAVAAFSRVWGQIAATVSPYHIGSMTKQGLLSEWRCIFATIFVICVISGVLFQIYGSAEEQEWAKSREPVLISPEEEKAAEEATA